MADAKRGPQAAEAELEHQTVEGQTYWFVTPAAPARDASHTAHLLPNYDDYFIGFRDRSAILDLVKMSKLDERSDALSAHVIVINGQVVGGWRRTLRAKAVVVELNFVTHLTEAEQRAVAVEAQKYGAFLELPVELA